MAGSTMLARSKDRYYVVSPRAPFFHNGSAATLMDAVNFYDTRFNLHLSEQDKDDLVAFLRTL
jgi:cytochrome c peroxidase